MKKRDNEGAGGESAPSPVARFWARLRTKKRPPAPNKALQPRENKGA